MIDEARMVVDKLHKERWRKSLSGLLRLARDESYHKAEVIPAYVIGKRGRDIGRGLERMGLLRRQGDGFVPTPLGRLVVKLITGR